MANVGTRKPLNPNMEERETDELDAEIETIPGMFNITGTNKKILIGLFLTATLIFLALNITMFIVGMISTKNCPIQPNIPIYLIVAGILGIANKALTSIYYCKGDVKLIKYLWQILLAIEVIWGIAGSYWVYSIYKPNFIEIPNTLYCKESTYLWAFWLITIHYIFGILLVFFTCCIFCALLYMRSKEN